MPIVVFNLVTWPLFFISSLFLFNISSFLKNFAGQNNILPDYQAGFRKKNSCQDRILRLNQHIIEGFNKQTACIMFDLEKAFDKASHAGILLKLNNHNLPQPLYNWIKVFLAKRSFHVTWNSANSRWHDILTGVPQASCLSSSSATSLMLSITR